MCARFSGHEPLHPLGDSATHPIEPRYDALAALLVVAGTSPRPSVQAKRRTSLRWALPGPPHHGPLGRVQLPFPG